MMARAAMMRAGSTTVALGDVVRQAKDKVSDPLVAGITHYVPGGGISAESFTITQWEPVDDGVMGPAFHMRFLPGHVLYKSRVPHGVAVADRVGLCANTTFVLEPSGSALLPELLPFILITDGFRAFEEATNKGSTNLFVNFTDIAKYELTLPPLEEQRQIAELMLAFQASEECTFSALREAERLADSLRYESFERAEYRWVPLEQIAEVTMGRQRAPRYHTGENMVPYLRSANAKDGAFDLRDILSMDFSAAEQEVYALRPGDVMVTEGCGSLGQIGANAVWHGELPGTVCFQNTLLRLRARPGISPGYVQHWARHAFRTGAFARVARGTNVFHIGSTRAKEMPVAAPPRKRQEEIVARLDALEYSIYALVQRLRLAKAITKAAGGMLLSGERA